MNLIVLYAYYRPPRSAFPHGQRKQLEAGAKGNPGDGLSPVAVMNSTQSASAIRLRGEPALGPFRRACWWRRG